MQHSRPKSPRRSACSILGRPAASRSRSTWPLVMDSKRLALGVLAVCLTAASSFAAGPAIIPLPKVMTNRPGLFTLCPSQPIAGAPARATQKILVDSPSLQTGQYLATMLFKSTGYQFVVATNGAAGPVRGALLLTTVNALTNLGAEGYELTVAPDSVVIRAPAQAGAFLRRAVAAPAPSAPDSVPAARQRRGLDRPVRLYPGPAPVWLARRPCSTCRGTSWTSRKLSASWTAWPCTRSTRSIGI